MATHDAEIASTILQDWYRVSVPLVRAGIIGQADPPWATGAPTREQVLRYAQFLYQPDMVTPNPAGREALKARLDPQYPQAHVLAPGAAQMYEHICNAVKAELRRQQRELLKEGDGVDALEAWNEQGGDSGEYQDRDQGRQATRAGGGHRVPYGPREQEEGA